MSIIAILIMSAAVPWIGALMAMRSAAARAVRLRELMSRRKRRRPFRVCTYSHACANAIASSM